MWGKTKYVVYDNNGLTEDMIIFPETTQHFDAARGVSMLGPLISAGFLLVGTDVNGDWVVECWGESISLDGLKSRPKEDAEIAKRVLGIS